MFPDSEDFSKVLKGRPFDVIRNHIMKDGGVEEVQKEPVQQRV